MSSLPVIVVPLLVFISLCYGARVPSQGGILGASAVPNYKIIDSEGPSSVITKVISSTSPVTHVSSPETNGVKAPVNITNISKTEQKHSGSMGHKEVPNTELHKYHETSHTNPLVKQEEEIYNKDVENSDVHLVSNTNESKAKPGSMMGPTGISNIGLDSTIDEEIVETRPNIPEISNLKIAVSHTEQLSPVIFQILSTSSTESNDISPEILPLKDNIVTEKTMKIEIHDEKILDSISKISSSIPPKQKTKFATGKHQETVKINSIEDDWMDLEKKFRTYTDTVMKKALPKFLRIHSQLNISSQCNAALMQMAYGLRNLKSWAIKSKSNIHIF